MDGDDPAADAAGAGRGQRADAARHAEPRPSTATRGRADRTCRTPTSPTSRASAHVTRKIRSGSWDPRSRARKSTSTVDANEAVSSPATASATPAAYRQRTSKANRSAASRSLNPSRRCSTITTAGATAAPSGAPSAGIGQ
jgi:hypothetical protein